ncbi:aldo/keto reductase [Arthrobacter sp.]|uniref:aldo/keto reductase n=1 Tax=Arthrobacter sp. TaxID=1667 RepID=UPI003396DA27
MKYRTLTGTGISVSNLALGTMGFGSETAENDAFGILDRFIEAGGNLIDTANVYGAGASEEVLGRWFTNRPERAWGGPLPWQGAGLRLIVRLVGLSDSSSSSLLQAGMLR